MLICSYCGKEYSISKEDMELMNNSILLKLYCSRDCYNQKGKLKPILNLYRHIKRATKNSNKLQNIYKE